MALLLVQGPVVRGRMRPLAASLAASARVAGPPGRLGASFPAAVRLPARRLGRRGPVRAASSAETANVAARPTGPAPYDENLRAQTPGPNVGSPNAALQRILPYWPGVALLLWRLGVALTASTTAVVKYTDSLTLLCLAMCLADFAVMVRKQLRNIHTARVSHWGLSSIEQNELEEADRRDASAATRRFEVAVVAKAAAEVGFAALACLDARPGRGAALFIGAHLVFNAVNNVIVDAAGRVRPFRLPMRRTIIAADGLLTTLAAVAAAGLGPASVASITVFSAIVILYMGAKYVLGSKM